MGINKVQYGNTTLIDLTSDTVTADKLMQGYTAHDRTGAVITGTATGGSGSGAVWQDAQGYVHLSDEGDIELQTKTVSPTESAQTVTADAGYYALDKVNVGAISPTYVGSGITRRSSTDLTASGATVTVPSGYYSAQASKSVSSGSAGTPTASKGTVSNHAISVTPSVTNTTGYITGGTKTGTAVSVSASELVSGTYSVTSSGTKDVTNYASASVPSGTEGTPTATKGAVSNHSVSVTPSVTNSGGYITGSTKTGTAVSVSASELVSGTKSISANGTGIDVTNYASVDVAVPSVSPTLITKSITANGTYNASSDNADGYSSVTVNVSGGGESSYTYIGATTYNVSTTSTSAIDVGTFATGNTSIWTSNKMVFVKIRDLNGRRNGHFYGSDNFICNNAPGNNLSATASYLMHGTAYYQNAAGNLINMSLQRTGASTLTAGYGVYATRIYNDGSIDIQARYSTSSSLPTQTIDGDFKVEVYLLEWPDDINPFIG